MMCPIIDFHSHILPAIDDGSESLEMSIAMLKAQTEQGIGHVVATPHFYPRSDDLEAFLQRRTAAENRLRREMQKHADMPQLSIGAEVHFFPGMSCSDGLKGLTIDGKECILIEMPVCDWTPAMYRELEAVQERQGLTPIIAHIDRYVSPLRTRGILKALDALPVLVQANAAFFLNPMTRHLAMKLLREERIHLLGSDCHNLTSRPPRLAQALDQIEKWFGGEMLDRIASCQNMVLGINKV